MHDVHFRQMDLNVPVWELVNVGDHWDVGVDVSKTTTITQIMTDFLPLYERIATGDIDVVLAEVAMNQFPEQFAKTDQRWFSVRMRDNTYRTAPFGTLNVVPRLSAMIYNIERLQFVKEIKERCFEQKGDSLEVFYLCIIMDDSEKAVRMEKYVSRQVLARNHVADRVVRSYDDKYAMPTVKHYVNPEALEPKRAELWCTRVKWLGPRTLLPEDWPMDTCPSGCAEGAANAAEVTSGPLATSAAASMMVETSMHRAAEDAPLEAKIQRATVAAAPVDASEKLMHSGAKGAPPAAKFQTDFTNMEYQKMTDTALDAATAAQEALSKERAKTEELTRMLEEFTANAHARERKQQEEEQHARERKQQEEEQHRQLVVEQQLEQAKLAKERACANCGLASTDTSTTFPCGVKGCSNWTHVTHPCGLRNGSGIYCNACFAALCNAMYCNPELTAAPNSSCPVYSPGNALELQVQNLSHEHGGDREESVAGASVCKSAKYAFTGVLTSTPRSSETWYSTLQVRKQDPIQQGTITVDGVQLHAFTTHTVSKKIIHIAMVTPTTADLSPAPASVMISWLNLESQTLDVSKCRKYVMPRDVLAALNSPLTRPRGNPFAANLKQESAKMGRGQKRQAAKAVSTVLSGDDAEGDSSEPESDRGARLSALATEKRRKEIQEIRELRKQVKLLSEAAAAAGAAATMSTLTAQNASKAAAASSAKSPVALSLGDVSFAVIFHCYF
jgi:hypothetical protein